jgi:secreted Zn-dependent insulinase-like peptidase
MASTLFGRSADYETGQVSSDQVPLPASDDLFDPLKASAPQQEPVFGTHYWCQKVSGSQLQEWSDLAKAQLPHAESLLSLPQQNQFIPTKFSLKALPPADCDHPLLNCSIKLQITVGKRKVSNPLFSLNNRFAKNCSTFLNCPLRL